MSHENVDDFLKTNSPIPLEILAVDYVLGWRTLDIQASFPKDSLKKG